jgi:hypothetical protein
MARKLTSFMFFYNTPLTDYQNTIHFSSNSERDDYFLKGKHFSSIDYSDVPFNFIRDRSVINLEQMSWEQAQGINYCTFKSDFENRRYYAFVNHIEYVNDHVTRFYLVIDVVMTYTQGNVLTNVQNAFVERQHLPKSRYEHLLPYLRNNDDVIKASNKYYIANYLEQFGDNYVMFQSSADLSKKFGNKKEPNLDSSKGTTYDVITSPVNIYIMDYGDFIDFMDKMSKYPWITQNFQKIILIPKRFINSGDMEKVKTQEDIEKLYTLKKGGRSNEWTLNNLSLSFGDLQNMVDIKKPELKHLIRNEYFTIECYSWNGDSLLLDAGKITEKTGIKFKTKSIIGYHNEVRVYPVDYNSGEVEQPIKSTDGNILIDTGSFLNTAIVYDSFAEVPVLIDNGILGQSQQANRMKNAQSNLITNRVKNIATGDDIKSKFFDAASIASSVTPSQLFGKFNDEYQYYKQQQAEFKDLALQPPSVTSSQMGNAFQIANSINGLTMKIGVPSSFDMENIMQYYYMLGFETNEQASSPQPLNSWTVCNYLRMRGTYTLNDVDPMLMEQLKALLESGVRFWHNDGSNNPMGQNVFNNKFRS